MLTDPTGEFTLDNLTLCVRNAGFGISRPGLFWYTAVESCFDSHFAALQPGEIELDGLSIGRCCGNGLLDQQACGGGPGESPCEQCDDGNNVAGDGCSPLCRIEDEQQAPACGDGIVQIGLGEQCDDGNQVSGDGCEPDCTLTYPGSACPAVGMCILPHNSPGCSDPACCSLVCGIDPNCCAFEWTPACVQIAVTQCDACLGECFNGAYCDNPNCCANPDNCVCYPPNSPISQALCPVDCNSNGIPDSQEPDCNGNGVPDDCDVATGYSQDLNTNGVPDECECVGAGVPGDVNNDGAVNFFDILTFLDCFGGPLHATDVGCPCSDFDADRDIDLRDFASFQAAWPLTKAAN
jgi:cysteine-rich repeat protein